jgi:hypothetical protein
MRVLLLPVVVLAISASALPADEATSLGTDAPAVRVAFVSDTPPDAAEREAILAHLTEAQEAVAEASGGTLRIRFQQLEHTVHRVEAQRCEEAYREIAIAVDVCPSERVLAFVPQARRSWPGLAARPLSTSRLQGGAVAVVWADGWRGQYRRYRVALHELMHTLGAVHDDAPGSDRRGHSLGDGDLMTGVGSMYCHGRGWRVVDCRGDSYFNIDPEPGSWLAENPEWNIARSPFLESTR